MSYTSFEQLECWQLCREVRLWVTTICKQLPKDEQYDLKDNIRRAARSTTRNIAEGFGRYHHGENIQFCRISRGSLFEILDDAITAKDDEYISQEEFQTGKMKIDRAIKSVNGYIKYLTSLK